VVIVRGVTVSAEGVEGVRDVRSPFSRPLGAGSGPGYFTPSDLMVDTRFAGGEDESAGGSSMEAKVTAEPGLQ